ncbi:MOSC and FAD-binding oxidoreductase domain-containing protein [Tengunoibacter tsumagoiensis]|uniref:Sulfurase n=1 Tax=Tengunoibacter tsumagoiensis TaxID=2014871 RepID=A0A402A6B4_9CHLR|nr:MOSC and FAD-binding oxidoreductase domain-containing protein [Tengunoibacter tsumagoiensis]GCE14629.1 sulfurase [Tengunoibacter tsumagoiensis]
MSQLLSVNVGIPQDINWHGETVRTAVWKQPVQGGRMVRRLNIEGDQQGDLGGHGGENRAVFVYQIDSYHYWEQYLHRNDFVMGQFGENFTVDGVSDEEVCIGDQYRIGTALFEVTQPRVTCFRVGIRLNEPTIPALLVAHKRPGFYLRVLQEGIVEAGDDIIKIADGPERMTVAEISALLYLSNHSRAQVERALRIPPLSPGWKTSFQALLEQMEKGNGVGGNAGLGPAVSSPPAWQGFRPLKVERIERESQSVLSLVLVSADEHPLALALPGQFVVLRLQTQSDASPLLRNYSLSSAPAINSYRVSIKQEFNGRGSTYIHTHTRVGDILDVSAPRGTFVYRATENRPVVFLSAGVGATPVLAMLHTLANQGSSRDIWWLYGAQNSLEHPFAQEACQLLEKLPNSHKYICYSRPTPQDRQGIDFDAPGRLSASLLSSLGVPREADFYLCGPGSFLQELQSGLIAQGIPSSSLFTEIFGQGPSLTPGIVNTARRAPHVPDHTTETGVLVSFARSNLTAHWDPALHSLLELAEACDVPVRWSCRTGVCHTCESGLISGTVHYQPDPLEAPASGNLLICCSQPQDEVVIDL